MSKILRNTKLVGILYTAALVGTVYAQYHGAHALEFVCKPLLMVLLSLWFYYSSRRVGDRFTLLVQAGLFFALLGDVALMFTHVDEFNFLIGLGAFFLCQLCYAIAFAGNVFQVGGVQGLPVALLLALGIPVFAWLFAWDMLPMLDAELMLPVVAYTMAIGLMGMMAAFRYMRTFLGSFLMVYIGSLLFIASDSFLAYNRFMKPFSWAPMAIMLTYAAAQWLIASGCLRHVLDPDNLNRRRSLST